MRTSALKSGLVGYVSTAGGLVSDERVTFQGLGGYLMWSNFVVPCSDSFHDIESRRECGETFTFKELARLAHERLAALEPERAQVLRDFADIIHLAPNPRRLAADLVKATPVNLYAWLLVYLCDHRYSLRDSGLLMKDMGPLAKHRDLQWLHDIDVSADTSLPKLREVGLWHEPPNQDSHAVHARLLERFRGKPMVVQVKRHKMQLVSLDGVPLQ